jgi:hypothetical protein
MRTTIISLLVALVGCLQAGEWRIALIPPADNTHATGLVRTVAQRVGLQVDELSPADFVDPEAFNAKRYPMAVFTGHERYAYTVTESGDGAKALLRYLNEGGTLLVAGICWPLYRPCDWDGQQWQRSNGKPPAFSGRADDHLAQQMQRFNQNTDSSFNRQLGLNISGTGTEQFEKPDEPVTFTRLADANVRWPEDVAYPLPGGDMRYRPVSTTMPFPGPTIEPLVTLKGKSGTDYGTAFALVTHVREGERPGVVAYVAEPLLRTPRGEDVVFTVVSRVAGRNDFGQRAAELGEVQSRLAKAQEKAAGLPPVSPVRELLCREAGLIARAIQNCEDAASVGSVERMEQLRKATEARLETLEGRLGAK